MKLKLTLFLILAAMSGHLSAQQDSSWTRKGAANVNLSQSSLTNWAAGGESAVGLESMISYNANYKGKRQIWDNRFEFAYGLNNTDANGTRKTNDKIYLSSTYGYEIGKNLYLSALATFQTQFVKGYNYGVSNEIYISKFMAPGYLTTGAGLTWAPKAYFTVTFNPAAWRGTFVTDDSLSNVGAYGVKTGKHLRSEFGANMKAEVTYEFLKNMTVYSRLTLYSNYLDKPENVDVSWDVILNMKVNDWFSANITTNLLYDHDQKIAQKDGSIGPRVQFKEVLGIGLHINFK